MIEPKIHRIGTRMVPSDAESFTEFEFDIPEVGGFRPQAVVDSARPACKILGSAWPEAQSRLKQRRSEKAHLVKYDQRRTGACNTSKCLLRWVVSL